MNYSKINLFDIANGTGIRVSLFLSGCKFHCKGCFNKEAQSFNYGAPFTEKEEEVILERLSDNKFDGLSLLGGDPLWQDENGLKQLIKLVDNVHKLGKNVWIWSGFTIDEVMLTDVTTTDKLRQELISKCDTFIDGRFEIDKRDLSLAWRGSSNQRIIHNKK